MEYIAIWIILYTYWRWNCSLEKKKEVTIATYNNIQSSINKVLNLNFTLWCTVPVFKNELIEAQSCGTVVISLRRQDELCWCTGTWMILDQFLAECTGLHLEVKWRKMGTAQDRNYSCYEKLRMGTTGKIHCVWHTKCISRAVQNSALLALK